MFTQKQKADIGMQKVLLIYKCVTTNMFNCHGIIAYKLLDQVTPQYSCDTKPGIRYNPPILWKEYLSKN